jgi:hypothetical protein
VRIPPGNPGRTVLLAEPADGGWHAALDGTTLHGKTADGWAEAWEVPPGGGEFTLTRGMLIRHTWLWVQAAAVVVVIALALPGGRGDDTGFEPWPVRARRRAADRTARADQPDEAGRLYPPDAPDRPVGEPAPAGTPIEPAEPAEPAMEPPGGRGSRRRGRGVRRRPARGIRLVRGRRRAAGEQRAGEQPASGQPAGGPAAGGPADVPPADATMASDR